MKIPGRSNNPAGREPNSPSEESERLGGRREGSLAAWLRSWRYFFWFLGLVLVIGLFYAEENWRGHRAWQTYKHRLEARGERLDSKAFVPRPVRASENFASTPFLAPLFEFIPGTQRWSATNAVASAQGFAPGYDAAAKAVKLPKSVRSNSWVTARTDLFGWRAAFVLKGRTHNAQTNGDPVDAVGFESGGAGQSDLRSPVHAETAAKGAGATEAIHQAAASVLAGLSECDTVIEEIRAASQRPYSRFNLRYDEEDPAGILLPHLGILKHLSQVLQLRASSELALGRSEEAAADVNLMLYLAEACRDEPIMVSQLIRMAQLKLAIQPIAEGLRQWSEPQLRGFQEKLRRFDFAADMQRALQAERVFFGGGIIDFVQRNPDKFNALAWNGEEPNLPGMIWATVPGGWFDFEKLNYSRLFENYEGPGLDLAAHRISPTASRQADKRITGLVAKSWPILFLRHRVFCGFLMPGFSGPLRKTAFAQTAADTAAIACALERYRLVHGEYPESPEALTLSGETPAGNSRPAGATGFIDKLPNDIITGQPLKYRRTENGQYVVYSVGWNETDDRGEVQVGTGTDADVPQEGDWVFRRFAGDR